jgi:hypothetical protein
MHVGNSLMRIREMAATLVERDPAPLASLRNKERHHE